MGFVLFIAGVTGAVFVKALMEAVLGEADDKGNASKLFGDLVLAVCVIAAICFLIFAIMEIWFFTVVLACFRFFRDKNEIEGSGGGVDNPYRTTPGVA